MNKGLETLEELKNDISNRALLFSDEKIIIIEKELKELEELKIILLNDLDRYEALLVNETQEYMRHYYQGKIDYIGQLSVQLNLEILDQI